jgi:hypothetical protein
LRPLRTGWSRRTWISFFASCTSHFRLLLGSLATFAATRQAKRDRYDDRNTFRSHALRLPHDSSSTRVCWLYPTSARRVCLRESDFRYTGQAPTARRAASVKRYRLWRLQGLNKLRTGVEAGLQTQTVAASDISECHRRMHELDIATVVQGVARQV